MNAPLLSLVIPACGCARFLPKLFESLERQTFRDFEVLFAVEECDDGSLKLCQDWCAAQAASPSPLTPYPHRAFSLPRTGAAGASRNKCYLSAKGDYLVPVDGDDWIDDDALEHLAELIRRDSPDVVLGAARVLVDEGDGKEPRKTDVVISNLPLAEDGAVMSGTDVVRSLARRGLHCRNHAALVTVRRAFLRRHVLLQLVSIPSEDSEWTPRVLLAAKKVSFLGRPYYNYRRRAGSVSFAKNSRILFSTAVIALRLADVIRNADPPQDVARHLANDAVSIFNWYLFNRVYARQFSRRDRLRAIHTMTGTMKAYDDYCWLFRRTSRFKRLGFPLIILAAKTGFLLPATLYYRYFYYPFSKFVRRG